MPARRLAATTEHAGAVVGRADEFDPGRLQGSLTAVQAPSMAVSTIKRRLVAIREAQRLLRMPNPIADEEVVIALRRALRSRHTRPHQALDLTSGLCDRLISACPDTLTGNRDRALTCIGLRHAVPPLRTRPPETRGPF